MSNRMHQDMDVRRKAQRTLGSAEAHGSMTVSLPLPSQAVFGAQLLGTSNPMLWKDTFAESFRRSFANARIVYRSIASATIPGDCHDETPELGWRRRCCRAARRSLRAEDQSSDFASPRAKMLAT